MEFSYHFMKKTLYVSMTVLGAMFLLAAYIFAKISTTNTEPISLAISAGVLALVGALCLLFGFATFLIRDDPDVWR